MSKYPSQMQDKFNLRFPDGMRDAIAERAKANGRSMNSEIIQILQDALDGPTAEDAFNVLLSKMANWYANVAPQLEQLKDMDDDQLRKLVAEMESKKPT
ncbi:Arc family DNA-binding protein [Serratia marcescens]|uniref:Arc family DNA-binding protein n=1 Tax=Serratia marcescens TaxID=615 RepID=UPI0018D74643|nr:Arc family DNA-binding protein [Serratia marcescens]